MPSNFKQKRLVDRAYRDSARNRHCAVRHPETGDYCNQPPVLAHIVTTSNSGMGIKPPDDESLFLCTQHHDEMDGRRTRGYWSAADWREEKVYIPERKAAYRKYLSEIGR